jgi:tRNA C32,U32 (ribose-2'-O)-methylase TrmJ
MKSEFQTKVPDKFVPHNGMTDGQIEDVISLMDKLILWQASPQYESTNLANAICDLHFYILELKNAQDNQRHNRFRAIPHDGR